MHSAVVKRLGAQIEDFLPRWTENMSNAGYLASTTAKREDCILSYRWFLEPLLLAVEQGRNPSFGELIANNGNWADKIVQTSRRHRSRGVTGDMFVGCFKTLVHAVLELIDKGDEPAEQKAAAAQFIRHWADAFETIFVRDWTTLSQQEANDSLDRANRVLTMEKCKYENIIDAISELVFVLDTKGSVLEANRNARLYFQKDPAGDSIWELLGLEGFSMEEILTHKPHNAPLELSMDDAIYFSCVFTRLKEVSLSSDGYLAVLKDISWLVSQREILKEKSESIRSSYLDILEDQLLKLTPGGEHDHHALLLKLTPTEMKVCQFIQAGATTKDIAEALNLSVVTIQTHRRNIRRKLDLQHRNVNLFTFLNHAFHSNIEKHRHNPSCERV